MSEGERMGSLLFAFFVTALGAMCFWELNRNERMAIQGYIAHRLPGSNEVYWFRPDGPKESVLKGF